MNRKWRRIWVLIILVCAFASYETYALLRTPKQPTKTNASSITELPTKTLPLQVLQQFIVLIDSECVGQIVCIRVEQSEKEKHFCLYVQMKTVNGETAQKMFEIPELQNVTTDQKGLMRFEQKQVPQSIAIK